MYYFKLIFFLLIACSYLPSNASIIRDSEIEEAIELTIDPLKKAAGIKDLKIHIIDDPSINSFTAGGNEIYITSGLLIDFPDPDTLRGILAHEIGHLQGQHVIRSQEIIDSFNKAAITSTALGIATALSGRSDPGLAITLGGMHLAERSVKSYSRTFESSADQTAMRLLEKSGHSTIGLINFFQKMQINSKESLFDKYDQTHPLNQDRLLIIQSFNKRSKFSKSQNSEELKYKFARSSSKLMAYTINTSELSGCKYEEYVEELNHYVKAIKSFRVGKFDDAINHVQKLLILHPADPFYHELKGQILFEAGKKMALEEYNTAIRLRPKDTLFRLGRAIVGVAKCQNDPFKINYYYNDLLMVIKNEPDNLLARFYLAIIYDKKGLKGESYLNSAIISYKTGKWQNAKMLAKEAMKEVKKNSPEWYKAYDILQDAVNQEEEPD